jgi:Tol biopolymer transport system component
MSGNVALCLTLRSRGVKYSSHEYLSMIRDPQPEDLVREPVSARLETWKQIAGFFNREVRTVQRWEKTLDLPVHRYRNAKQDSVYAFEHELNAWREARRQVARYQPANATAAGESVPEPVSGVPAELPAAVKRPGILGNWRIWATLSLAAAFLIGIVLVRSFGEREKLPNDLASTTFSALAGQQFSPTFSPDGRQIAFTWNGLGGDNYDLYVREVGSFSEHRLTTDAAIDYSPAWSPNGKAIAFCRGAKLTKGALLLLPLEAGAAEQKVLDLDSVADPGARVISWSTDSSSLVLADQQRGARHSLYLVDVSTHKTRQLTFPARVQYDFDPSFSPDGRRITFVRQNGEGRYELHLLTLAGDRVPSDRILPLPGFESDFIGKPAWTPDSSHILFVANHNGETGLWLISTEFPAAPHFVPVGRDVTQPAISKAGQLVYTHREASVGLWKLPLAATTTPVLLTASRRRQDSPQISPQGDRLAFSSNRVGNMNVWVSSTTGSSAAPLTFFKGPLAGSPSWSPDGLQIVFDVHTAAGTAVYTIASTGGVPRKVSNGKNFDGVPFWAPDGNWIYFSSDRTGRVEIWKMHPDGAGADQVTKTGGFAGKPSADGKWLYYTRTREDYSSLWQFNLQTGKEQCINALIFDRAFAPTEFGVVFVPVESKNLFRIFRYDHRSGAVIPIHKLLKRPYTGISVSPNQDALFYAQTEPNSDQMYLIQDFWR